MSKSLLFVALLALGGYTVYTLQNAPSEKPRTGGTKVDELINQLKSSQGDNVKAVEALAKLGEKAAPAVPELLKLFNGDDEYLRVQTAITLGKIGKPAVAPLIKSLGAKNADVRFYGVWSLGFIGHDAKSATDAVVKALSDDSADVRRKAAYTLGRIDPEPKKVVGALVDALGDKDADVRNAAAASIPQFGNAAVSALLEKTASNDSTIRNVAITTIGEIGSEAKTAIPLLKKHLLDPEAGSTSAACAALVNIGAPAIPVLVDATKDERRGVRMAAIQSLRKIGAPAVPHLVDLLGAKYVDMRQDAANILGYMQIQDKMIVIGLGYALKDKDNAVRLNALQSLYNFGTDAKLAQKYVTEMLSSVFAD